MEFADAQPDEAVEHAVSDESEEPAEKPKAPGRGGRRPKAATAASDDSADADDVASLRKIVEKQAAAIEALQERVDPTPPTQGRVPLHRRAAILPMDTEATKKLNGRKVAELADVAYEDIMGYSVRAPRNIDDEIIDREAVLTVALRDGSKKAVFLDGHADED